MIYKNGDTILVPYLDKIKDGIIFKKDNKYCRDLNQPAKKRYVAHKIMYEPIRNEYAKSCIDFIEKNKIEYIVKAYNNDTCILNNSRNAIFKLEGKQFYLGALGFVKRLRNNYILNEWITNIYKINGYTAVERNTLYYLLSLLEGKKFYEIMPGMKKQKKYSNTKYLGPKITNFKSIIESIYKDYNDFMKNIETKNTWINKILDSGGDFSMVIEIIEDYKTHNDIEKTKKYTIENYSLDLFPFYYLK